MGDEFDEILSQIKRLRERRELEQKMMADMRARVKSLEGELKTTTQEKDAALAERNDQVKKLKAVVSARDAELARVRADLRITEDSLTTQLVKEREEWHARLHEQERSAQVKMKNHQRFCKEVQQERDRQSKAEYEAALTAASEEAEMLVAQRAHFADLATRLAEKLEKLKSEMRIAWHKQAENFIAIADQLVDADEVVRRPGTPPKPENRAKRLLEEFRGRDENQRSASASRSEESFNKRIPTASASKFKTQRRCAN